MAQFDGIDFGSKIMENPKMEDLIQIIEGADLIVVDKGFDSELLLDSHKDHAEGNCRKEHDTCRISRKTVTHYPIVNSPLKGVPNCLMISSRLNFLLIKTSTSLPRLQRSCHYHSPRNFLEILAGFITTKLNRTAITLRDI